MTNFPRFDLQESSYAMALMADRTPAWREVYAETLDGLVQRYTQFWAACRPPTLSRYWGVCGGRV